MGVAAGRGGGGEVGWADGEEVGLEVEDVLVLDGVGVSAMYGEMGRVGEWGDLLFGMLL